MRLPGTVPSPNIWNSAAIYEIENNAFDRDGRIEAAMRAVHDWSGQVVLDIGCGTGFHLPRFAATAAEVIGVEPHPPLLAAARRRIAAPACSGAVALHGTAQRLPVADASVDLAHARWAYFFGPGCEPGLRELQRVVRRGGTAFLIDNDASESTFGNWFRRAMPGHSSRAVEQFFAARGWTRRQVQTDWTFDSRADMEAVVGIEFAPDLARELLSEVDGLRVDYAVNLWTRVF